MKAEIRRIVLFARNMEVMTEFYEKLIGLPIIESTPGFVDFDAGGCKLALHRTTTPKAGKTKICFYTKDVSAARKELISRGVRMGKETGSIEELNFCNGKDPEGNIIQVSNRP